MIKVSGPRQVDATSARRVARKEGSGTSQAFQIEQSEPERTVAHAGPAMSMGAVDSLLALQAVPDSTEGRRRALKRASEMLDLMDDIRLALLAGEVPSSKLQGLLRVVQSRRDEVGEPQLNQVLDEIELRARVELAKYAVQS